MKIKKGYKLSIKGVIIEPEDGKVYFKGINGKYYIGFTNKATGNYLVANYRNMKVIRA